MKDRGNHSLRDGIIATVIGGLILTVLTYLYTPLFTFLQNLYKEIRGYLSGNTSIPNSILWLVILLIALLIAIAFTIFFTRNNKNKKSLEEPDTKVQQLQEEINKLKAQAKPDISKLAGLDDKIKISCTHRSGGYTRNKSTTLTWKEIFSLIAPFLLERPNDTKMKNSVVPKALFGDLSALSINDQDYETIKIHLIALELITVDYLQTTTGGMALFWTLTRKGQALLMDLRSVKKE